MPASQLDIFGNRRFAQIEADIVAIKTDLAAILKAVNSPAWLMPPAAPSTSSTSVTDATTVNVFLPVIDVGGQIYSLLDQIIAGEKTIEGMFPPPSKATNISVEIPLIKRKDTGKMANFEIDDDWVVTATIKATNSAGVTEPVPAGDVFSVASSSPSLGVAIGTDSGGNPAVVMTPMVQASPNITVSVTDSAGLMAYSFVVDIVPDVTPTAIVVDLADATHATQTAPTAPGP